MMIAIENIPLDSIPAGETVWDFTTINDILTCPKFGIIRRIKGLRPEGREAPALAAGSAVHKFCAAFNIYPTLQTKVLTPHERETIEQRLFPDYETFLPDSIGDSEEQKFYQRLEFASQICEASGFEDYENDTRRTLANIVAAGVSWATNMTHFETVVEEDIVGIELPFCMKITTDRYSFYYGGIIDQLRWYRNGLQFVDYKTTGASFQDNEPMNSHQFTGYWLYVKMLAGMLGAEIADTHRVHKIHIPPLKATYDSQRSYVIDRYDDYIEPFIAWIEEGLRMVETYRDAPLKSIPMFTHSCMRFFRPCMYANFCDALQEDQEAALLEMVEDFWSPVTRDE